MNIQHAVPLAPLTTFGIGGNAAYYVVCSTKAELIDALNFCKSQSIQHVVLAGGSNVLISDEGYSGCVLHVHMLGSQRFGNTVTIEAGANLLNSIRQCHEYNLGGWEGLSGIPGSIGGALRGNVGAFGTEIREYCTSVRAMNSETMEEKIFENEACEFSYRSSFFKENSEWIILSGTFTLTSVTDEEKKRSDSTILERERRHLQNIPCAGSYFMNPVAPQWVQDLFSKEKNVEARGGRVPAGWLIEKVGMKGFAKGGAASSSMHANYLINTGNARASDVRDVASAIQEKVRKEYIVNLAEEPTLIGFEQT